MPSWTHSVQQWRAAEKSIIRQIQTVQPPALRVITNVPFCISNHTVHTDLKIHTVEETAKAL